MNKIPSIFLYTSIKENPEPGTELQKRQLNVSALALSETPGKNNAIYEH